MPETNASDADPQAVRTAAFEKVTTLDEIRLSPGDTIQLQVHPDGEGETYTVRAIGQLKPLSVLVTAPVVGGRPVAVEEGQPLLVRSFSGLNVCTFRAVVIESRGTPYPHLHLSYPEAVAVMRIRKSVRARVRIPVILHDKDDGRQLAGGRIIDLSAGGAGILSSEGFGEKWGTVNLAFKVKLDDIEESLDIPAVIHHRAQDHAEDGRQMWTTAVRFRNLAQPQRLLIMNLVYQQLLRDAD